MKSIDKAIAIILIGGVFPMLFSFMSVVLWFYSDKNTENLWLYFIPGLCIGLLTDAIYLNNWIKKRYLLPTWFIAGIYFFHNICIYILFIGVPVFNIFLGLIAGYYYSQKIRHLKIPHEKHEKIKTEISLVTAFTIAFFCAASGIIALTTDSVGEYLRQIVRVKFEVTKATIFGIILAGGITLVGLQYFLTKLTMNIILRSKFNTDDS